MSSIPPQKEKRAVYTGGSVAVIGVLLLVIERLVSLLSPSQENTAQSQQEVRSIKKEVEDLKSGMQAVKTDVAVIRNTQGAIKVRIDEIAKDVKEANGQRRRRRR